MKKVGVVVASFPVISETFILNQIDYLIIHGYDVTIYRLSPGEEKAKEHPVFKKHQLERRTKDLHPHYNWLYQNKLMRYILGLWILLSRPNLIKKLSIIKYGGAAYNLFELYKTYFVLLLNRNDILHIHFANNLFYFADDLVKLNKKTVVSIHGFDMHFFNYSNIQLPSLISFVSNSNYLIEKARNNGFENYSISRIPVGLDTNYFTQNNKIKKSYDLIFIGRFIKLKGPHRFIEILNLLKMKSPGSEAIMIGDGPEKENCMSLAKTLGLENSITFLEGSSQAIVKQRLNESRVLVMPGIYDEAKRAEAQGLVIQEAQSMEVPVVISDAGGMHENIVNKESGFVCDRNSLDSFVTAITSLLQDRHLYENITKVARQHVVKNFDNTVIGKKLLDVYHN